MLRWSWPSIVLTAVTAVLAVAMHGATVLWVLIILATAVNLKTNGKAYSNARRLNGVVANQATVNANQATTNSTQTGRINGLSAQATTTTDAAVANSTADSGLTDGTVNGNTGGASTGAAHTHTSGTLAVSNGHHTHGAGTLAANHDHNLPTV
jgi:uncharacterized membrane protein